MLLAWSLMMTMFGCETAAMWPYCGISGRRILTSSPDSTFWAAITRVMSSSGGSSRTSPSGPGPCLPVAVV